MENLKSSRVFKIWEYQVSHGQLLIRSPKSPATANAPEYTTNVDIIFLGVEYMAIPRMLRGVEIVTPTKEEAQNVVGLIGQAAGDYNLFVIVSGGRRFVVVASMLKVHENDWDIFRSPFQFRSEFILQR